MSGRVSLAHVEPGQLRQAFSQVTNIFHFVPSRELDPGDLSTGFCQVRQELAIPFQTAQFYTFDNLQRSWFVGLASHNSVDNIFVALELSETREGIGREHEVRDRVVAPAGGNI